jgi:predicted dehydrogenase
MLKIGIIGAENSHCGQIAKLCNLEKKVPARVTMLWGETEEFAAKAAEVGRIPTIVKDWRTMLGKVDGIMIDHRHAKYHARPASFFLDRRVPCFVDKPFAFTLAEAKGLCALARRRKVPLVSFSTIPLQKTFLDFKKAVAKIGTVANVVSTGPADLNSQWGGLFFYAVHQVEAIVELLGTDADWVNMMAVGKGGVGVIAFKSGAVATVNCLNNGSWVFHWTAAGDKEFLSCRHASDPSSYLTGARLFIRMFQTGRAPWPEKRLLAPVAILEALAKSLKAGRPVKVAPLA